MSAPSLTPLPTSILPTKPLCVDNGIKALDWIGLDWIGWDWKILTGSDDVLLTYLATKLETQCFKSEIVVFIWRSVVSIGL